VCESGFVDWDDDLAPGVECQSNSEIGAERVYMKGQDMWMGIWWHDKTSTENNTDDVIALFKHEPCATSNMDGCRQGMRQLWWAYTSSTVRADSEEFRSESGCLKPMARFVSCTACENQCLRPGQKQNLFHSQMFEMMAVGYGDFSLMLWSGRINEVIAISSFAIAPPLPGQEGLGNLVLLEHSTNSAGAACRKVGSRGAYSMYLDGTVEYCPEGTMQYQFPPVNGSNQKAFDSKFRAYGGLLDCIGRHYAPICINPNSTCSPVCHLNTSQDYFLPIVREPPEVVVEEKPVYYVCGDGRLTPGSAEECDDKNFFLGDGCDPNCKIEDGYECSFKFCLSPSTQNCADSTCRWIPACGDGTVQPEAGEECDDYNKHDGDGCSGKCSVENGWVCEITRGIPPKSRCFGHAFDPVCGASSCPPSQYNHSCPGPCHENSGRCIWYKGNNYCMCVPGFIDPDTELNERLTQTDLDKKAQICADFDECAKGVHDCLDSPVATCSNTVGSFECGCEEGYMGSGLASEGANACVDQNECTQFANSLTGFVHNCHSESTCSNTQGSYTCACNAGFDGLAYCCGHSAKSECGGEDGIPPVDKCYDNDDGCEDKNECQEDTPRCAKQAECANTEGSYVCTCRHGFVGSGLVIFSVPLQIGWTNVSLCSECCKMRSICMQSDCLCMAYS